MGDMTITGLHFVGGKDRASWWLPPEGIAAGREGEN
jgi:hypothetical protein